MVSRSIAQEIGHWRRAQLKSPVVEHGWKGDALCDGFDVNLIWSRKGIPLGHTRIGAHAGTAVVGNFGGGRFFDYSAYGDTINVAARLEAANKTLGTRICVSGSLAAKVQGFCGRPVGDLLLRGRSELIRAFEPLDADRCVSPETLAYIEAFEKMEACDPGAIASFAGWSVATRRTGLPAFI